ncbi:hypothetical protein PG997_011856 [Apiospora hydei]|uniref:Nudix hydrolase domain-containing protein n=1 Tax=Apiospora hydei TaxID=1337664 RepID=A0ABR1V1P9_9PEZI
MYSTDAKQQPPKGPPAEPRPSSSIILLSHTNQVLLLRRVKTSRSFASAHVFPGGNLSGVPRRARRAAGRRGGAAPGRSGVPAGRHPGDVRGERDPACAQEEGGAPPGDDDDEGRLLVLSARERDEARRAVYGNEVAFTEWLDRVGGVADIGELLLHLGPQHQMTLDVCFVLTDIPDNLLPFTRWVTPLATPRRFTTQMYIYMLPFPRNHPPLHLLPTPDGAEITTSAFEDAATWLARQQSGDIILFPPQAFLLTLISQFCRGPPPHSSTPTPDTDYYQKQRDELTEFLRRVPTAEKPRSLKNPTSQIPWADKCISPVTTMMTDDGRILLSLDRPGPELKGTGRGGDFERVVLVRFEKGTARQVEVMDREEAFKTLRPAAPKGEAGKEKL